MIQQQDILVLSFKFHALSNVRMVLQVV